MNHLRTRRVFLQHGALSLSGLALAATQSLAVDNTTTRFELSLHQYSVKKLIDEGLTLLNYARFAKETLGISNIEFGAEFCGSLLNSPEKARAIRERSTQASVTNRALLCAAGSPLDAATAQERSQAVNAHLRWAKVAEHLGCEFMRVRASTEGDRKQQLENAVAGIGALCDAMKSSPVSVLIENIAGFSRNAQWLVEVVERIGTERVGLIADFGNFDGDIYAGMKRLLPYAKSICTKSWEFDEKGNETKIDFQRMMKVITESNFKGCIAIEYLGEEPVAGIRKTAELIRRFG